MAGPLDSLVNNDTTGVDGEECGDCSAIEGQG